MANTMAMAARLCIACVISLQLAVMTGADSMCPKKDIMNNEQCFCVADHITRDGYTCGEQENELCKHADACYHKLRCPRDLGYECLDCDDVNKKDQFSNLMLMEDECYQQNNKCIWRNEKCIHVQQEVKKEEGQNYKVCSSDKSCSSGMFCAVECFTGQCGDSSVGSGVKGKFCQPCNECEGDGDAVSGSCNTCKAITCKVNERAVDNVCVACPVGKTSDAGNADTSCVDLCAKSDTLKGKKNIKFCKKCFIKMEKDPYADCDLVEGGSKTERKEAKKACSSKSKKVRKAVKKQKKAMKKCKAKLAEQGVCFGAKCAKKGV